MSIALRLLLLFFILAGCAGQRAAPGDEKGFYTWVDQQGNLHTVSTAGEDSPAQKSADVAPATVDASAKPASSATPPPLVATTPDELWQISEENYQSADDVQARLDALERDRFVSYPDPDGRVLARPVDLPAERDARKRLTRSYEDIVSQGAEFGQAQVAIRADCCTVITAAAEPLALGDEIRLDFLGRPRGTVHVEGDRLAHAFALAEDVEMLGLQSWVTARGYMHPQILFLNHNSVPVLLVDNLFSRRYPETFFSHRSLMGTVPVPDDARWAVVFLGYSRGEADGWRAVDTLAPPAREVGVPLLLEGDAVVRALASSREDDGNER